jgi:hypothetical protein
VREWKEASRIHLVHGKISKKNEKSPEEWKKMEGNIGKKFPPTFCRESTPCKWQIHYEGGKKQRDITGFPAATSMRSSA